MADIGRSGKWLNWKNVKDNSVFLLDQYIPLRTHLCRPTLSILSSLYYSSFSAVHIIILLADVQNYATAQAILRREQNCKRITFAKTRALPFTMNNWLFKKKNDWLPNLEGGNISAVIAVDQLPSGLVVSISTMLLYFLFYVLFIHSNVQAVPICIDRAGAAQESNSPLQRTLAGIVWSCLSTIIICAWTSVHPNVPPPNPWKARWNRLRLMFWMIIAPELVLAWAVRQLFAAREIRDEYNNRYPSTW